MWIHALLLFGSSFGLNEPLKKCETVIVLPSGMGCMEGLRVSHTEGIL
ncbi:MAG: hypothetical protein KDE56_14490 [Anaerolineales bacterium]|nr:hypothetical protein [Anaerolineales bacterium]